MTTLAIVSSYSESCGNAAFTNYGILLRDIVRRIKWLIDANSNTSVTLHSPRIIFSFTAADFIESVKKIMRLDLANGIKGFCKYFFDAPVRINRKLIKYAVLRKCHLIVHTMRARSQIEIFFSLPNVIPIEELA